MCKALLPVYTESLAAYGMAENNNNCLREK